MGQIVFSLCAVTSIFIAFLLARAYWQKPSRILFWSAICFAGLALNNIVLFYDLVVTSPDVSYAVLRNVILSISVGSLIYGLIWDVI